MTATVMPQQTPKRILVVGPFMHRPGHFTIYPTDLARGFVINGAEVTLLSPFASALPIPSDAPYRHLCLTAMQPDFCKLMAAIWARLQKAPHLLALVWIVLNTRKGDYDLVYWTDFKSDNQQSTWPLALARTLGLFRHRTAFTEHHNFNWTRHRLQRLFRLDRLRLHNIKLIVHSTKLLDWVRLNMGWPEKGQYVPYGLWPAPAKPHDRLVARDNLGIAPDARVLLVFGIQAIRRKEIDTLATALETLTLDRPLVVIFAGMRTQDEAHPFDAPSLRDKPNLTVHRHESFIAENEVNAHFAAADAVWAYYGSFIGASGVLMQAIAYGRLSICSNAGESGDLARQYGIGLLPPTDDAAGVAQVLQRYMTLSADEQAKVEAAACATASELAWPNATRKILDYTFPHV